MLCCEIYVTEMFKFSVQVWRRVLIPLLQLWLGKEIQNGNLQRFPRRNHT